MKERPILFSAPMVRALLAGTKTQTRRMVKPQPALETIEILDMASTGWVWHPRKPEFRWNNPCSEADLCRSMSEWRGPESYAHPGDRLWVRETWAPFDALLLGSEKEEPQAIGYRASEEALLHDHEIYGGTPTRLDTFGIAWDRVTWKPSIFMPRWASRIPLEVTGVRVERLHDISEGDAIAEGISRTCEAHGCSRLCGCASCTEGGCERATWAYANLWREINGAESWDANPWVWVIEFRRFGDLNAPGQRAAGRTGR